MAHAMKCPCGHRACKAWMVAPQAAVQGVRFTQEEAEAVAKLLDEMELFSKKVEPDDEIMSLLDWAKAVKSGLFIPSNGFGVYATATRKQSGFDAPDPFSSAPIPQGATHVVWYNK